MGRAAVSFATPKSEKNLNWFYAAGKEATLAVFDAVRRAAALVRSGEGTRMVELRYFRRKGHAQHDPQDYVDPALIAEWEKKDPIDLYRARMLENGWASEEELQQIDEEEFERCRAAAEQAVSEPMPEAVDAVLDVYTDAHAPRPWTRADRPDPALA